MAILLIVSLHPVSGHSAEKSKSLATPAVARLVRHAERHVDDPAGWASDILASLDEYNIEKSRQNVCSVIAVVDQESNFVANPKVAGLGRIAYQTMQDKLDSIPGIGEEIKAYLSRNPSPEASYVEMIQKAETERDLDLAYRHIVAELSNNLKLGFLLNTKYIVDLVENLNKVATLGSMQTSVQFAISIEEQRRRKQLTLEEINDLRDFMYTRKGGLLFGTQLLLGYRAGYADRVFLFADFNAGRYSSRNAAFQSIVSTLSKARLALDGDLLIYERGQPSAALGQTEKAIRLVSSTYALGLSDSQIRSDILSEKTYGFIDTATYRSIYDLYRQQTHREAPFAIIPEIALDSIKLSHKMTTRNYAERVKKRFNSCMRS